MYQILHRKDLIVPEKKQLLLGIFCWVMFDFGFYLIFQYIFDLETAHGAFYCQIATFCACFLLTTVCFMPFLQRCRKIIPLKAMCSEVLKGYGYYYILNYAAAILVGILNSFAPSAQENLNQAAIDGMLVYEPLPMILCTCLLAPITEELLVRGVIFAPLCRKNPLLAYLVSSTIFAAIHVIASIGQISAMNAVQNIILYFPSGLMLGYLYQRTRTIYAPIALHCTMNTVSVLLTFLLL